MSQVNESTAASGINFMCVTGQRSPQLALAMLMLNLADTNKKAAMDGIKDIEAQQAQKKEYADAINAARDLKAADNSVRGSGTQQDYENCIKGMEDYRNRKWAAVGSLKTFPEEHGIKPAPYGSLTEAVKIWDKAIDQMGKLKTVNAAADKAGISMPTSSDKEKNNAEWDKVIAQLQTKMDSTGADIQTKMVQLQDMMGQYNSYTSGATSAIAKSNDILSSLARGQ